MNRLPGQEAMQFKVPMIGDANVGKTSIVARYTTDNFVNNTPPTVGVSTANINIKVKNDTVELSIWDTAGQEKFRSLVPLYTRHASLLFLVFDMSSSTSFAGVEPWIEKLHDSMGVRCPIFLCGNKCDLTGQVSKQNVEELAEKHKLRVFYTSAVTGEGIKEMFQKAAEVVYSAEPDSTVVPDASIQRLNGEKGKCC